MVVIPEQPKPHEEIKINPEKVYEISVKLSYNKPAYLRKLKKIAEDFKFAEENTTKNTADGVVRLVETDRYRMRKLNDYDFKDYEFPAKSLSLGLAYKNKATIWKRP
jgi:hypothetical protein